MKFKTIKKAWNQKVLLKAFSLMMLFSSVPTQAFALTTYHSQSSSQMVSTGIRYLEESRMTEDGVQNIHVIEVDLTTPDIEIRAIESATDMSLKETTKKMASDHGAVAAINGDFFGLVGTHSASFGIVVEEGEVMSAGTAINKEYDQFASFFLDTEQNGMFDYIQYHAYWANEKMTVEIAGLNKVPSITFPVYLNRAMVTDTSSIDARYTDGIKYVVEDDVITYISLVGETMEIPENGYVIVVNEAYYHALEGAFAVGDTVEFSQRFSIDQNTFDIGQMNMGFGGGSLLLTNGVVATASQELPNPTGREPRTAFGLSADGTKAILMVVDGRGDSIGATHLEMAHIMSEYGGYQAMHLDGGGSSTLVAQTLGDINIDTKNQVSQGTERNVISSVGVFRTSEVTDAAGIQVVPNMERLVVGKAMNFEIYGFDRSYNRIEIPIEEVEFMVEGVSGTWEGSTFTPLEAGDFTCTVFYHAVQDTTKTITASTTARLVPTKEVKLTAVGETSTISVQSVDIDGFAHWVSPTTNYECADPTVGIMNGNTFEAVGEGSTYIICTRDGHTAYVPVQVGTVSPENVVPVPEANSFTPDSVERDIVFANDGATYFNLVGNLVYSGVAEIEARHYLLERDRARKAMNANGNIAIYGSGSSIVTAPSVPTYSYDGTYQMIDEGGASFILLNGEGGSIRAVDPTQYTNLANDLQNTTNETIVIMMNQTPSQFNNTGEADFLRMMLEQSVEAGKNVFVISCSGTTQWSSLKDGIRYINMPDLWQADGVLNPNFSMVKMRIDGSDVSYGVYVPS